METVTLHSEDFKTVHNTLCELRSVQERLTGVISNDLADRLHRVVKGFEQGLANAYEQDRSAFDRKMDHYDEVRQAQGFKTVWSIYEIEELGQPHPFEGALQVVYKDHWGDQPVVEEINGPRWVDLYAAADAAIRRSGDDHHIFIEAFRPVADQPHQLRLTTGS